MNYFVELLLLNCICSGHLEPNEISLWSESHTLLKLNYASHLLLLLPLAPAPAVVLHLELLLVKVELGEFVVVRHGLDLTIANENIKLSLL